MKRVKCPKCDQSITFDETRYKEGQALVFECPVCHRQFGIRMGTSKLMATRKDERNLPLEDNTPSDCGKLLVIENVFHYKQTLDLQMGDNVIGRYVQGSSINTPIETVDPSVDTTHCVIHVRKDKAGRFIYTLRDGPSGTGTFVGNTILRDNDRLRIEDGTIITIGATTMILRAAGCEDEETTAESR